MGVGGFRQVRGLANAHGAVIAVARGRLPYESVEEVWRRAQVPRAAIERLAEADAFHTIAENRRQGLWKVKGLGEAPLPLFAAADAREVSFSAEGKEPDVALRPLTQGREVVEDYRALQLSLRAHPLEFLRGQLTAQKIVKCAELQTIPDGRHVEVAGVILVRQRPGSARGVLFITIEDETGVANGILWPDVFEKQRRTVMSASMVSLKGRLQKEGLVIHVIIDRVVDRDEMLRSVGNADVSISHGRGDGATHSGSPDRGEAGWKLGPGNLYSPPLVDVTEAKDMIRVVSHDFH